MYLCFQVTQTDISIVFNLHNLHLVTSHLSTSGIGAMSRHRNETHLKGKSCNNIIIRTFVVSLSAYLSVYLSVRSQGCALEVPRCLGHWKSLLFHIHVNLSA